MILDKYEELIVLLDAGHGPATPGKRSPDGTLLEFQFNRPTAEKTRDRLLKYQNVKVLFVHYDNSDRSLQNRTDYANTILQQNPKAKVIYISIHANAFGSSGFNDARGVETYVYSTKPAGALALAQNVQKRLLLSTNRPNRGVKAADFHVLRETKMDAILVEAGFMTNKEELALLKSDDYRNKVAQGIAEGVAETYKLELIPPPKPAQLAKDEQEPQVSPAHAEAWQWLIDHGITQGNNPTGSATRQQVGQMIYDAIQYIERSR